MLQSRTLPTELMGKLGALIWIRSRPCWLSPSCSRSVDFRDESGVCPQKRPEAQSRRSMADGAFFGSFASYERRASGSTPTASAMRPRAVTLAETSARSMAPLCSERSDPSALPNSSCVMRRQSCAAQPISRHRRSGLSSSQDWLTASLPAIAGKYYGYRILVAVGGGEARLYALRSRLVRPLPLSPFGCTQAQDSFCAHSRRGRCNRRRGAIEFPGAFRTP